MAANRGEFLYEIIETALNGTISNVDFIEKYNDIDTTDEYIFIDMSGEPEAIISERVDAALDTVIERWSATYEIWSGFKTAKSSTAQIRTLANTRKDKIDERLFAINFPQEYTHNDGSNNIYKIRVDRLRRGEYINTPTDINGKGVLIGKGELIYELRTL